MQAAERGLLLEARPRAVTNGTHEPGHEPATKDHVWHDSHQRSLCVPLYFTVGTENSVPEVVRNSLGSS